MSPIEKEIATRLIDTALERGYAISVWEGEDFAIKRSKDREAIIAALASTDEDRLTFWDVGIRWGSVLLIWGNGEDLISDHTDNACINEMVAIANKETV